MALGIGRKVRLVLHALFALLVLPVEIGRELLRRSHILQCRQTMMTGMYQKPRVV